MAQKLEEMSNEKEKITKDLIEQTKVNSEALDSLTKFQNEK